MLFHGESTISDNADGVLSDSPLMIVTKRTKKKRQYYHIYCIYQKH